MGYNSVMTDYANIYAAYKPYAKHAVYYGECFKATTLARIGAAVAPLEKVLLNTPVQDSIDKYVKLLQASYKLNLKDYDEGTDREMFAEMTKMYYRDIPKSQQPDIYQREIFKNYGDDNWDKMLKAYSADVYKNTFLMDQEKFDAFCKNPTLEQINNDPAIRYALSFVHNFEAYYQPKVDVFSKEKKALSKRYVKGLMEMNEDKLFYPDANSTMRISYGKVLSYEPQDAVFYKHFTTLEGLMAKYKPGNEEFDVPEDLVRLYKKKNYGPYADADGSLHTCFITNNDITGGNSGSPVINANGELMGCAFDGNWEAMSGDIAFDKKYKRTIVADIRFILFLIDKMGGAHNLIEEMDIRR
jgi:hypothetical protein